MLNLKTPPQLLINLIYLVFTGVLSLNVSNNYIKRLSLFEQNFQTSNRIIDISNTRTQKSIEEASSSKYQLVIETAKTIRLISARFTAYIENLRGEMLGTNVEHSESSQGDGWWSNTYRTEKTISWERVTDLETEIKETRAEMLKVMGDLLPKMGNIGQDPNLVLSDLDKCMPLGADEDYKISVLIII